MQRQHAPASILFIWQKKKRDGDEGETERDGERLQWWQPYHQRNPDWFRLIQCHARGWTGSKPLSFGRQLQDTILLHLEVKKLMKSHIFFFTSFLIWMYCHAVFRLWCSNPNYIFSTGIHFQRCETEVTWAGMICSSSSERATGGERLICARCSCDNRRLMCWDICSCCSCRHTSGLHLFVKSALSALCAYSVQRWQWEDQCVQRPRH